MKLATANSASDLRKSPVASKPDKQELLTALVHGADRLPAVDIDAYNAELSDKEGFVGDRASGRAFRAILEAARDQAIAATSTEVYDRYMRYLIGCSDFFQRNVSEVGQFTLVKS